MAGGGSDPAKRPLGLQDRIVVGLWLLALGAWFIIFPVWFVLSTLDVVEQTRGLERGVPSQAVVISTQLAVSEANCGGEICSAQTYKPKIVYEYQVEGRRLKSDRLSPLGNRDRGASESKDILGRYRPGETARVYFDPGQPSRAFLVKELAGGPYGSMMFSLWLATFTPYFFFLAPKALYPVPRRDLWEIVLLLLQTALMAGTLLHYLHMGGSGGEAVNLCFFLALNAAPPILGRWGWWRARPREG